MADDAAGKGRPKGQGRSAGARVRAAIWLRDEVGEGEKFTTRQLREAIPGVNQVDRRMRSLRQAEWIIHEYRTHNGLAADEFLLEKIGVPLWEPGMAGYGLRSITGRVRNEVMARDLNRCVRCGIGAGEPYPDDPDSTARLTLGHVKPSGHKGSDRPENLVTECARCNETAQTQTAARPSVDQVWDRVSRLGRSEKRKVLDWLEGGGREFTAAETTFMLIRQLPGVQRDEVIAKLREFAASGTDG